MRLPSLLAPAFGLASFTFLTALGVAPARAAEQQSLAWRSAIPIHVPYVGRPDKSARLVVDLRPEIRRRGLHIRDQGNRGTCTVFATTFLIEYRKSGEPGQPKGMMLSEEYLNWAANQVNGTPYYDGGMFTKMIPGFDRWGISRARGMPYQATYNATSPVQPSRFVEAAADKLFPTRYRFVFIKHWDNTKGLTQPELQRVLFILGSGRPVALGMWWLSNFSTVTVHGVPILKDYPRSANVGANPPMFDGHSIDLVGFHQSTLFPGGGYFVFRNSFGPSFGDQGYGYVSFQYIRTYGNDAIAVAPQPGSPKPIHPILPPWERPSRPPSP